MLQDEWAWCNKSEGLFYGATSAGVCPSGNGHDKSTSANYVLDDGVGSDIQHDWRWCNKCQGLFYNGKPTDGWCPAGGSHNHSGSADYGLNLGTVPGDPQQDEWRWCHRCQGLFYSGGGTDTGWCPAGGGHDYSNSGNYFLSAL